MSYSRLFSTVQKQAKPRWLTVRAALHHTTLKYWAGLVQNSTVSTANGSWHWLFFFFFFTTKGCIANVLQPRTFTTTNSWDGLMHRGQIGMWQGIHNCISHKF